MSPHEPDDLRRLFSETVDDIEPAHGLDTIRARTAQKESAMDHARNWMLGAFGAAVATAAVITGVVVLNDGADTTGEDPGPADSPSVTASADPSETPTTPPNTPNPSPTQVQPGPVKTAETIPVYYLGETPFGPRLYREFQHVRTDDPLLASVTAAVQGEPVDPDYRSAWPDDARVGGASYDGDVITVDLTGNLHDRPAGRSAAEAQMAVEQLVFTAQAAVGEGRLPVRITLDGGITDQVLGVPTSEPLSNGPILETLSHVSLTLPEEGQAVRGGTLEVNGVANSFEANVLLQLRPIGSDAVALEDFATAEGYMEEKLFPFQKRLDVSGVAPGRYLLVASTDDASGQGRFFTDTRTVVVE